MAVDTGLKRYVKRKVWLENSFWGGAGSFRTEHYLSLHMRAEGPPGVKHPNHLGNTDAQRELPLPGSLVFEQGLRMKKFWKVRSAVWRRSALTAGNVALVTGSVVILVF